MGLRSEIFTVENFLHGALFLHGGTAMLEDKRGCQTAATVLDAHYGLKCDFKVFL